ncbi:unnamed protein product [Diabrotica balteata]|uniref:Uncharacterized protein n=1 Tax=Diabrotica balteata TaxID=107213 RepID=A0A9N9SX26_DIABA|nr:unnamed protein product [Diabrotica balteata]
MTLFSGHILKILSNVRQTIYCRYSSRATKKSKKATDKFSQYLILKACINDYPKILESMHQYYYNFEPTCYSIGLHQNSIMDQIAMQKMAEGMTLVARCKYDGHIVGAAINESSNPWDPDLKEKLACHINCPQMKHWLLFQAHLQRFPKLWDCMHVQKIFEMTYIFVKREIEHPEFLMRMMEESRSLAADCGFKAVRVNASTFKISEICKKMKMIRQAELAYCSYLSKKLEPIFKPPYPNESVKVYIDNSPQKNARVFKST